PVEHFVIDGEIVALDERGRPSFQRLQPRMALTDPREIEAAAARVPVEGVFFDCLALDGHDLRRLPLTRRKDCLRLLVPPLGPVHYVDHVLEHGPAFLEAANEQRLEGIVAKKAASSYTGGRSRDWIKVKCQRRQEFVIGGYTDPQGSRGHFGALRSDKRPEECRREAIQTPPEIPSHPSPPLRGRGQGEGGAAVVASKEVKLTNLKKMFWPVDGYTKGDLVAYYERVAPLLLPYLRDRPLVLTRYPDGITGKSFFQKDAPEF